ncbi:MAG: tetratricopeptide repeat protein [Bacteroidales bacterium]
MKASFTTYKKLIILLTLIFFLVSCSTKKNKWYNRAYHTTVAHYNAYWNGNDAFKQGVKSINDNQKDDFSRIIPVFKLGTQEQASSIKPNMDRAIEKSSKVIKKHSMVFNKKERNPEIKKAYLLIGKASFYQKDYKVAQATFRHIQSAWKDEPIMYNAMIWQAFTSSMEKDYSLAESTLDQVRNKIQENKAPKKLNKFLYSVYAENAIAQKKYSKALEYIQLTKKYSHSRSLNTRLMFIEAQLYQQGNELEYASKIFGKVAIRAKKYDMRFAAQLRQAMCYDPKKGDSKKIKNKLEKMATEEKNIEYNDQIYYALAEIFFKDKNVDKACEYWAKSVSSSFKNVNQRIASSIRLADVNYELLEKYETAHDYYDTALTVMKKDYPEYNQIKSKQIVLANLVTNLRVVTRWDSLLALSVLSQADLDKKIDGWIKEYKRQQEEIKKAEQLARAKLAQMTRQNPYDQNRQTSSWYFYNLSTVQAGKAEFMRIWGPRKLEDNWRLSDKQQSFDFDNMDDNLSEMNEADSLDENGNIKPPQIQTKNNPAIKEFYTKDIPKTQEKKDSIHIEISKALLEIGYIYYQGLTNNGKAIETFLELQKRYPGYPTTLPSSYHLYKIYEKIGQTPNSNYYKNKVLNEFPESDFALMIQNPDYWKELNSSNSKSDKIYNEVYSTYATKDYKQTIFKANQAIDSISFGPYIPRLLYIEAIAKGKLFGIDSLMNDLNMIVYNYPEHPITPTIENQLKYLSANYNIASQNLAYKEEPIKREKESNKSIIDNIQNQKSSSEEIKTEIIDHTINDEDILDAESLVYRYRDMEHFYVMIFDDDKLNSSEIKIKFSNYNSKFYKSDNLKLTSLLFTMSQQMITVNRFESIEKAMNYYKGVISNNEVLNDIDPTLYKHFIISTQNYPTFYNRKNIPAYLKFFRIFYLKPPTKE